MTPDDPRHGLNKGYIAGCRDACCRRAHMIEQKRYRMRGRNLLPAQGTHRRIHALVAIGWPTSQIARRLGHDRDYILKLLSHDRVQATTHVRVAAIYDELSMQIPEDGPGTNSAHKRALNYAARNGWAPPLAWDDIDNDLAPTGAWRGTLAQRQGPARASVDHARVERIVVHRDFTLAGEATQGERAAVVARWPGTLNDLERLTGWRVDRYHLPNGAA